MGIERRIPPNYGRSVPAVGDTGSQLARVEVPATTDMTVYLFGWNTPSDTNNVIGRYYVTHASGGIAIRELLTASARGTVLHYAASVVQVDTVEGQSPPLSSLSRARIGIGRPQRFELPLQLTAGLGANGSIVRIPDWVTEMWVTGSYSGSSLTTAAAVDARVTISHANDPTMATSDRGFLVSDITATFGGRVPMHASDGFVRARGGATSVTIDLLCIGYR